MEKQTTTDQYMPQAYVLGELYKAFEYFTVRNMKPTTVSRNGDGEFTVKFSKDNDDK